MITELVKVMPGSSMRCGFRKKAVRAGKSRCGVIWKCLSMPISARRASGRKIRDRPFFRSTHGKTKRLTGNPLTTKDVSRMVKQQLKDAGLPSRLSPHSFRVTGITDLLTQGVPLDIGQPYCLL
jgi:integrase